MPTSVHSQLCTMLFDRTRGRFRLTSVHPGHTLEEVRDNTGFDFDIPEHVPQTASPDSETLTFIRGDVARIIAAPYPAFAGSVFALTV